MKKCLILYKEITSVPSKKLNLLEGAQPYQDKLFFMPKVHEKLLKQKLID